MSGETQEGTTVERSVSTASGASLVAEFRLDIPLLRHTSRRVPDIDVAVEQELAFGETETLLTIRAVGDQLDAFERAMSTDETVMGVDPVGIEGETERRYRLRVPRAYTSYWMWAKQGAVLLDATVGSDDWTVRMRFPNRTALSDFCEYCREQGWGFDLVRLQSADTERSDRAVQKLTDGQQDLLTTAFEAGYFDVPRGTTVAELATEFGISNQAASERLRRGLSNHLDTAY